ncbi:MAG: cyclic pyranopterin monophosphate synthase MoaC [Polyangiaceae bacterium]
MTKKTSCLTHLNEAGEAHMVDVGEKDVTLRKAVAGATVRMKVETARRIAEGTAAKGDVLASARIAGIMAAKRTPELIPLCHGIQLTKVAVDLSVEQDHVRVVATVEARARTGVEMEALVAASVAALTIYDMLKAVDRAMTIDDVALLEKHGGRSGPYRRDP